MFVLPPPPRYPSQMMYGGGFPGGQMVPMIETNNILTNPTGPECQFFAGEGLYVLQEDLLLATPPPHPSEAPIINPNPLATTPAPATAGAKVTLITLVDPPRPHSLSLLLAAPSADAAARGTSAGGGRPAGLAFSPLEEHPNESESGLSSGGTGVAGGAGASTDSTTGRLSINTTSAISGASDPALASASGSTPSGAGAAAALATSPSAGASATAATSAMASAADALASGIAGLGMGSSSKTAGGKQRKPKNSVAKSNSSFISRVIVNDSLSKRMQERAPTGLLAFANINRAFQWLDMASEKKVDYFTKILFTKAHCLCHDVNKLTKSASHIDVIMGFSTGDIIWWEPISQRYTRLNKNGIIRNTPVSQIRWFPGSETLFMAAFMDGSLVVFDKEKEDAAFPIDNEEAHRRRLALGRGHIQVERSIHTKNLKTNPVAFWKLSNQHINDFAFAPFQSLIAVVSEDGTLRVIDYLREKLLDIFNSYFGGLSCVCWSPDGKYVLTGGQDDLLTLWSVADATLVARFQGHQSWVTSVEFDPWRCDDRNYRFGSVGEDCRLCLWDFNKGMITQPKPTSTSSASARQRGSIASRQPPSSASHTGSASADAEDTTIVTKALAEEEQGARIHPVLPKKSTPFLPPVLNKAVDKDPLCWLSFTETSIMTSSMKGHIRTWQRPTDSKAPVGAVS